MSSQNVCDRAQQVRRTSVRIAIFLAEEVLGGNFPHSYKQPLVPYYCRSYNTAMARIASQVCTEETRKIWDDICGMTRDRVSKYHAVMCSAEDMLDPKNIRWNNIIAMYVMEIEYIARIATFESREEILKFANFTGDVIAELASDWISENGGWDSIMELLPGRGEFLGKLWTVVTLSTFLLGTYFITDSILYN